MQPQRFDPQQILGVLHQHGVEFVVVGGVGAVLQGAPVNTFDLDIVYNTTLENIQRLLLALQDLSAIYRDPGGRRISPTPSHLAAGGHNLLLTNAGPLDVLGYIGTEDHPLRYNTLRENAIVLPFTEDKQVLVVDLATLIAVKEQANREKDRAILPLLRSVLDERNRPSE